MASFMAIGFFSLYSVKNLHRRELFVTFLREKSKCQSSVQYPSMQMGRFGKVKLSSFKMIVNN